MRSIAQLLDAAVQMVIRAARPIAVAGIFLILLPGLAPFAAMVKLQPVDRGRILVAVRRGIASARTILALFIAYPTTVFGSLVVLALPLIFWAASWRFIAPHDPNTPILFAFLAIVCYSTFVLDARPHRRKSISLASWAIALAIAYDADLRTRVECEDLMLAADALA